MIPILYESSETTFSSNGLGRLRDCISCVVTEERNGIYECDFEYPVTGANYDLIKIGRIIGVTHEETDDIQPFDIVSSTYPIDGIVTFHCVHISYRLSFQCYVPTKKVYSLAEAFGLLETQTLLSQQGFFKFETDKTSTGWIPCINGDSTLLGIPLTVREILGGSEGSILDTYGGEYEFDKWTVILHENRGVDRDITIRYGVNMTDYTNEVDNSETFSSCLPYWGSDKELRVGSIPVDSGSPTLSGRNPCVPLDLSDKFETRPSLVQLQTAARQYMDSNKTYNAVQTINVSFLRLKDVNESNGLDKLAECKLCDKIKVVFPDYGTEEMFEIVETVWDVLSNRYEEMELGTLSTTLSEALGIQGGGDSSSGISPDDYIISKGKDGSWYYEKWSSGKVEAWGEATTGTLSLSGSNRVYVSQNVSITNAIPDGIFDYAPTFCEVFSHYSSALCYAVSGYATSKRNVSLQIVKTSNNTAAVTVQLHCIYYPASYN